MVVGIVVGVTDVVVVGVIVDDVVVTTFVVVVTTKFSTINTKWLLSQRNKLKELQIKT